MQRTPFRIGALALLLSFGLLACGDDGPTESTGDLSEAEVAVMMEALSMAGGGSFLGGVGAAEADGAMAFQEMPLDFTVDCTGGGTVQISGQIAVTGQGENVSLNLTSIHNSCTETAPSDGSSWTFNGNPSITTEMSGTVTETSVNLQGSQSGAIQWASGGRSGSCSTNVQYSMSGSADGSSGTVTISGTVCGHDVSESYSFSD